MTVTTESGILLQGSLARLRRLVLFGEPGVKEAVIDGPRGTGKSLGIAAIIYEYMVRYPGVRVLAARNTRVALTDSWLVTWEAILRMYAPHALRGATRAHRSEYAIGPSVLVPCGIDVDSRLLSSEWDLAFIEECLECSQNDWETLNGSIRKRVDGPDCPRLLLGATNPGSCFHWVKRRLDSGRTRRILSRHEDNPSLWDALKREWRPAGHELLSRLEGTLTGHRRLRLLDGEWVAAEGSIWPTFDASKHIIDASALPEKMDGYFGSYDWGQRAPGCLQVWGQHDGCIYRVAEVYRTLQTLDWWGAVAAELHAQYPMHRIVCDDMMGEVTRVFHGHLSAPVEAGGVWPLPIPARKGRDSVEAGNALVRQKFAEDRIFFVRDAFPKGLDPELVAAEQPTCTEEEVPGYLYVEHVEGAGKPIKEIPDPGAPDHGCDATRMGCMWIWRRELGHKEPEPRYKPGTMASVMEWEREDKPEPGSELDW